MKWTFSLTLLFVASTAFAQLPQSTIAAKPPQSTIDAKKRVGEQHRKRISGKDLARELDRLSREDAAKPVIVRNINPADNDHVIYDNVVGIEVNEDNIVLLTSRDAAHVQHARKHKALTYTEGEREALNTGKPLIVFIGEKDFSVPYDWAIVAHTKKLEGYDSDQVVLSVVEGGKLYHYKTYYGSSQDTYPVSKIPPPKKVTVNVNGEEVQTYFPDWVKEKKQDPVPAPDSFYPPPRPVFRSAPPMFMNAGGNCST